MSGTATALATGDRAADHVRRYRGAACATARPTPSSNTGLRRFSLLILRTTVALVLFILLMGSVLRHDPFESLLFAVALGVGLTPEFLPMIASVTLTPARFEWRASR